MKSKSLLLSLGAAAALGLNAQAFAANGDALETEKLEKGYNSSQSINVADAGKDGEGKDGEGKCGEGKCGEGKCGGQQ